VNFLEGLLAQAQYFCLCFGGCSEVAGGYIDEGGFNHILYAALQYFFGGSAIDVHAALQLVEHYHAKYLRTDVVCVYLHDLLAVVYF
jgi:hypothetical protein